MSRDSRVNDVNAPARHDRSANRRAETMGRAVGRWVETLETRRLFASVLTDKVDYAFGETAQITGAGFHANEIVRLQVQHLEGTEGSNADLQNQAWEVRADAEGSFTATWQVVDPDAEGATYSLTALGVSSGETARTLFTDDATPGAPADLSATAVSTSQINLSWLAGPPRTEEDFHIERALNPAFTVGVVEMIAPTSGGSGAKTFSDTGLSAGTTYYYRVRAHTHNPNPSTPAFSAYSNVDDATTVSPPNGAPTANGQTVGTDEDTEVTITLTGDDGDPAATQNLTFKVSGPPTTGTLYQRTGDGSRGAAIMSAGTTVSDAQGRVIFAPDLDEHGSPYATFEFTVTDDGTPNRTSSAATVRVNVAPVNDAPVIDLNGGAGVNYAVTFTEDGGAVAVVDTASATITDVDDTHLESLTVTLNNRPDGSLESLTANTSGTGITLTAYNPSTGVLKLEGHASLSDYQTVLRTVKYNNTSQDPNTTNRSITFVANDGTDNSNAVTTVTVVAANDAPVAEDDDKNTNEDAPLSFPATDLTANDTDVDGDTLTVTAVGSASHGTVSLVNGQITYTPASNYYGPDSFSYTISDGNGGTDTATVNVQVASVNDDPVAVNDSATAAEDSGANPVDVLANDNDGPDDGETLTVTAVTQGANGTVTITGGGTGVSYTPNANYFGADTFTYTISDGNGGSATATVSVSVTSVNDGPEAANDTATVAEDGSVTTSVLANDNAGPANEDQALTVTSVTQGANGTVTSNGTTVTYTPNANYFGSDSYTYTIVDGDGATDTATVTVTVTEVNDAPVATNDAATVAEDGSVVIDVLANDSAGPANESGQTRTVTAVTPNANTHGTVELITTGPDAGKVRFTPDANYNGPASFDYTLTDNGTTNGAPDAKSDTGTVNVTVTEVNDAPVADDDSGTVAEDGSVDLDVAADDSEGPGNESGQTLTVTAVTQGANGSVVINPDGTVRYTPNANFFGTDSFTYTVTDNGTTNGTLDAKSDTATVSVTVTEVNDAPIAVDDDLSGVAEDSGTRTISFASLLGNDTAGPANESGQTLTITAVSNAVGGTAQIIGTDVVFTPAADYNGPASFDYTVRDNGTTNGNDDFKTDVGAVSFTITEVNDAPAAANDSKGTAEDAALTFPASDLLTNDSAGPANESGQTLTVVAVAATADTHGTVVLNGDGTITYTPDADYHGPASFTYTVRDNGTTNGAADPREGTGTVSITVTEVNDAPSAVDDTATVAEDGSVVIDVLANDGKGAANESGQTLTVTAVAPNANTHGTVELITTGPDAGKVRFTPDANYNGPASFDYTVTDNGTTNGAADPKSDTGTVSVTVTEVNDAPVAGDDTATVAEDGSTTIDVLGNDSSGPANESGQSLTVTNASASHGTVTINPDGSLTYQPEPNYNGPDTITYTIQDDGTSNGAADPMQDAGAVAVTVTSVNDAPVATADTGSVNEDATLNGGSVLANDSDSHGGAPNENNTPLTAVLVSGPSNAASFTLNADGTYSYTPGANFNGTDSFTYRAQDSLGGESAVTTVTITVNSVNDAPVASPDAASTPQDTPVTGNVLTNDSDLHGGAPGENNTPLTAKLVQNVSIGTLVLNADGTFTYTPALGHSGTVTFKYRAVDSLGGESADTTVTLTVLPAAAGSIYLRDDACMPGSQMLVVNGSGANDNIHVSPATGGGVIVHFNGVAQGTYFATGRIVIFGYGGDDQISLAGSVPNVAWIYGDNGNDMLNLGNGGGIAWGGNGSDHINGGSGRDIMIGGEGGDRVVGNAGDDILIAGLTIYDNRFAVAAHEHAWCHIHDEWSRTNTGYGQRIDHLTGAVPGGDNGAFYLNNNTVNDDDDYDQIDMLTGSAGEDWFIWTRGEDKVNGMSSAESAEDLDYIS